MVSWVQSVREEQCHDANHSTRNLETTCCVIKTKHQESIMAFCVVTSDVDDPRPTCIFSVSFRLIPEAYIVCLGKVVLPWVERVAGVKYNIWQQHSAVCHTSKRTQSLLSDNFCVHITLDILPFNYPNCKTLGYYVWRTVQED